jgi:hypothetical protein
VAPHCHPQKLPRNTLQVHCSLAGDGMGGFDTGFNIAILLPKIQYFQYDIHLQKKTPPKLKTIRKDLFTKNSHTEI